MKHLILSKNYVGPCLLEIYVNKGSRKDLEDPLYLLKTTKDFISFLEDK